MQRLAWLNATPRPPADNPRAKTFDLTKALSRLDTLKRDRVPVQMPPLPMPHIIQWWTEIGMTGSNGMSVTPLDWSEIAAWQSNTRQRLTPWEARLIRSLSMTYVVQLRASEDETCPPPWRGEVTQAEKEAEVAILDLVLG